MRSAKIVSSIVLVAVMTMAAAAINGVPANAEPATPKGPPIATITVKASSIKGNTTTVDLECVAYWSPEPQYSASNHTIHYGIFTACNYTAVFTLTTQLFVKPSGSGSYEEADNRKTTYPLGTTGSNDRFTQCIPGSSGRWQARFWGAAEPGTNFTPYPSYSPSYSYPCG